MQFRITGRDIDAEALVVSCPRCKAEAGEPCDWKPASSWNSHAARGDKSNRCGPSSIGAAQASVFFCLLASTDARHLSSSRADLSYGVRTSKQTDAGRS